MSEHGPRPVVLLPRWVNGRDAQEYGDQIRKLYPQFVIVRCGCSDHPPALRAAIKAALGADIARNTNSISVLFPFADQFDAIFDAAANYGAGA